MSAPSSPPTPRPALYDRRRALALTLVPLGLGAAIAFTVLGLYHRISWLDEAVHGFNFFWATLLVGLFGYGSVLSGEGSHRPLVFLTLVLLGIGMGAVWEVVEWAYDQIRRPNVILGKTDTILDLIVDTAGAAVAGLLVVLPRRRGQDEGAWTSSSRP